ncbi:putative type VI secretion system effector [Herbaspirillum sp. B65]|uniref:putative type VI secretion system effector n=1 Tax=Herbaspirillum sp. B65 TaxID=137708 RepID=UPI0005CA8D81|nr:putative type VI secretion system effector [Herbaspirillum sp. B65]
MVSFLRIKSSDDLLMASGVIENYECTRAEASFALTRNDQRVMEISAVANALAGMGGIATSQMANASHIEEAADYVSFDIDGKRYQGWVWRSPFVEGDAVNVVYRKTSDGHELTAIARPSDQMIALYPYCSRGVFAHWKSVLKAWFIWVFCLISVVIFFALGMFLGFTRELFLDIDNYIFLACFIGVFSAFAINMGFKLLPFSRVAESVFAALGWEKPSRIDLKKTSKKKRKEGDPGEYGTFYFRY